MGKIFKALEKAEKREVVKNPNSSAEKSNNAVDYSDFGQIKKTRAVGRPTPQRSNAIQNVSQAKAQAKARTVQQQSASPLRSSAGNRQPVRPNTMSNDILSPMKETQHSAEEIPWDKVSAYVEHNNEEGEGGDAVNLELIRSVPDKTVQEKIAQISKKLPFKKGEKGLKKNRERKRINVRYSKTKVQYNDPESLKNNRVLSIFDDIETANQFKILRTQILEKLNSIDGNSILVTSCNPYEGKTFTSINLGLSIAKEFDRTVLIIDADIRRPTKNHTDFSTEFFSLKVEKGLTDYLAGDADIEDVIINPGIDRITLIPGGLPVDNSPELLNSSRMEKMMVEIKSRYQSDRLVIVDGPALLHYPDAMILHRYVDGVLPVVESERTSTEDVKKMMKRLQDVNLLGVVFNKNKG